MNDPESHDSIVVADQEASAHLDLYALPKAAIQDPPGSLLKALGQIGPGLILAGSIVGTGELIATTKLGASQGYVLLWMIVLFCVIKVALQVELGRYAITHGKTTLAAFDTLPGPRLGTSWMGWLWLIMMLATQAQIAAMEGLVGQAAVMAFPRVVDARWGPYLASHPDYVWATWTTLAAILLLISGGYRRLEKITTVLVAGVTAVTIACVVGLPWTGPGTDFSLASVARGLRFALPAGGAALAFATFGITGVGASELFAYPYWCIEKGYARAAGRRTPDDAWARRARGWLTVMKLDVWFSMVVYTLATVAFYILGAATLHPRGIVPEGPGMLKALSVMYTSLGPWTTPVFLVGAWAVLFKTLYVATAANSRLTADFLDLARIWPQRGPKARERTTRLFCVLYPALSLVLYLVVRAPGQLVTYGGYAQGLMLPLIAWATLYLRYRDADRRVAPSWLSDAFTWASSLVIGLVALYSILHDLLRIDPFHWLR
ncbi:MAG TPA: Nramp family divalent metal transporter [Isosphaeraceae bacterium]|jgi:Mn2+/Fe2+ NRAMP family transporter|nr:Nramp family divalent metal transporter [Isosphaeraceae bacterium]